MPTLELLVRIAIYAVATYRFSLLLYEEDGPFDMFDWLRAKAGIRHEIYTEENESGKLETKVDTIAEGFWAKVLDCPYCISGWIAIAATIGVFANNQYADWVAMYGCIWGVVHWTYKRMYY